MFFIQKKKTVLKVVFQKENRSEIHFLYPIVPQSFVFLSLLYWIQTCWEIFSWKILFKYVTQTPITRKKKSLWALVLIFLRLLVCHLDAVSSPSVIKTMKQPYRKHICLFGRRNECASLVAFSYPLEQNIQSLAL